MCSYQNSSVPARVFVVSNVQKGIARLKSPEFMYTVTGGLVQDCTPLKLEAGTKDQSQYLGSVFETNPEASVTSPVSR